MDENHLSMDPLDIFKQRKLERILSFLPEKNQKNIRKIQEEKDRSAITIMLLGLLPPEVRATVFEAELSADLPILLKSIADEYAIDLHGKHIIIKFPGDEGIESSIEIVDFPVSMKQTFPQNGKKDSDQINITVSDVRRNEQVNIVALSEGKQTILCSNLTHCKFYALWPMVGDSTRFTLSKEGEEYQTRNRRSWDPRLDTFPRKYIATVYAYSKVRNNTIKYWEDLKNSGLFIYWDPEKGPYKFYLTAKSSEIQMLRVYEVDEDLRPYIKPNAGYKNAPLWTGERFVCMAKPILSDKEMREQKGIFDNILKKYGNPRSKCVNHQDET